MFIQCTCITCYGEMSAYCHTKGETW